MDVRQLRAQLDLSRGEVRALKTLDRYVALVEYVTPRPGESEARRCSRIRADIADEMEDTRQYINDLLYKARRLHERRTDLADYFAHDLQDEQAAS